MTKLLQSPPLRVVEKFQPKQVLIRVHEPLLPRKEDKIVRQELYLFQQFAKLELYLQKIDRFELWKAQGGLTNTDSILKNLYDTSSRLLQDIKQQPKALLSKIQAQHVLYPKSKWLIFAEEPRVSAASKEQYHLEHLQQLYITACRLYHNLTLSDHEYIVYQLALLYQCVNRQGVPFISYKGRIEQRFSDMVTYSKQSKPVCFNAEQIAWLQSLVLDIIMQTTDNTSVMKCSDIFGLVSQINKQ